MLETGKQANWTAPGTVLDLSYNSNDQSQSTGRNLLSCSEHCFIHGAVISLKQCMHPAWDDLWSEQKKRLDQMNIWNSQRGCGINNNGRLWKCWHTVCKIWAKKTCSWMFLQSYLFSDSFFCFTFFLIFLFFRLKLSDRVHIAFPAKNIPNK